MNAVWILSWGFCHRRTCRKCSQGQFYLCSLVEQQQRTCVRSFWNSSTEPWDFLGFQPQCWNNDCIWTSLAGNYSGWLQPGISYDYWLSFHDAMPAHMSSWVVLLWGCHSSWNQSRHVSVYFSSFFPQPAHTKSGPPTHPDAMSEYNTCTALKSYGIKMSTGPIQIPF